MFDTAKGLLKYLPSYLEELFRVFFLPRAHISQRMAVDGKLAWANCLQFLFISFLLIFLLKWAAIADARDFKSVIVGEGILTIFEYVVTAGILFIIWRIFGVKESPKIIITPLAFMLGIIVLIEGMFYLTQLGLIKLIEPSLYEFFVAAQSAGNISAMLNTGEAKLAQVDPEMGQVAMNAVSVVSTIGSVFVLAWSIYAWPVYKKLFSVSAAKLYGVLVVFLVVDIFNPVTFMKVFVMALMA